MSIASDGDFEVRIFDPRGVPKRDIRVHPRYASILSDIGDCNFDMSVLDPAFREETIQFGSFMLINHTDLPSWVGMIDPINSRTWSNGMVNVTALSAERIFDLRFAKPSKKDGPPGAIFSQFINNLNEEVPNAIQLETGYVMQGGRHMYYPLIGRGGDVMRWIARVAKAEYCVTHRIDSDGRLVLVANLYAQKGTDMFTAFDTTNTELSDSVLVEDGEIFNYVIFYTSPQSGGKTVIIGDPQRDEESIGRFGTRMYLGEMGADDVETLNEVARTFLYQSAWPKKTITPAVLNVNHIWKKIDTGNLYWWETPLAGFTNGELGAKEYVRMSGYEVDMKENKLDVMVEKFDTTYTWRQQWKSLYG